MKKNIQQTKRFLQIISVALSFTYQAFIQLRPVSESIEKKRAILLREHIEKLGSVFVKFGQFISIHPTLLPPIYCAELFYLLENVPPFSKEAVLKTFKEEFQKNPEELFKNFDSQPFAAASFGQVHKAKLPTGEKVVVKIQRPHIYKTVEEDIFLMKFLAVMLDLFPLGPNKFGDAVREFELWTKDELDYMIEAEFTEKYNEDINKRRGDIFAPKVYKNYSSKRILTTEYIEGITFSKILLALRNNDETILQNLKKMGFSRKEVAIKFSIDSLKQQYLRGFFHGDPHPANIIYTKDNTIVYIDFGICGNLTKKERMLCLRYARCFWSQDFDTAFEALMQLCDISKIKNLSSMKSDFTRHLQNAHEARENNYKTRTFRQKNEFQETLRLLQKYKARISPNVLLYFRTAIIRRNIIVLLDPDMKTGEVARLLKKIAVMNLLSELPKLFAKGYREKRFETFINILERELTKNTNLWC